jgi:hypothetical protein
MICEPLELEYVASALLQEGHEVDLVDMLLEKKPLAYFLGKKNYEMVCFTAYITCVGIVKDYARVVKKHNKSIITCVGGVHAEVVSTDFVDENVDYILWANGVQTLVAIANAYPNHAQMDFPGVYADGKRKPENANGDLPFPDRTITAKYRHHYNYIYHDHCATIKTSFGCPYKCKFCFCTQICEYSARRLESVLDEIGGALHVVTFKKLNNALITLRCQIGIDRKFGEHLSAISLSELLYTALAIRSDNLATVGTYNIAVILHESENVYIHKCRHINSLLYNHGNELLRAGNYNDTVEGETLEYSEGYVTRSGRHIYEHIVYLIPNDL